MQYERADRSLITISSQAHLNEALGLMDTARKTTLTLFMVDATKAGGGAFGVGGYSAVRRLPPKKVALSELQRQGVNMDWTTMGE